MSDEAGHIPVLLDEALDLLDPQPGDVVVDCTVGRGGHAIALADRLGPEGVIVGFDLDPANLAHVERRFEESYNSKEPESAERRVGDSTRACGRFIRIHDSFAAISQQLERLELEANIVLADLGFSSNQMLDPARGLSFSQDGPLDMRLNPDQRTTAADLVNTFSEQELADVIYQFGEEPLARKIARIVAQNRRDEPIRTTARLARLVLEAYGRRARTSRMHPATRTFMALRIAVNDELGALRSLLDQITRAAERIREGKPAWLARGARVGVISFHSLEDRLVKQCFADMHKRALARFLERGGRLVKRPVTCSEQEAKSNPRARSAKMRVVRIDNRTTG